MSARFALLIGNSEYEDHRLQGLGAPLNDVSAFRDVLEDAEIGQFDDVKCLTNEGRDAISEAIEDLFADKRKDDLVLLYLSGHGLLDAYGRLFFAVPKTRIQRVASTGIAAADIRDWMDRSFSQRQVLFLDCCHGGAFNDRARGSLEQRALTQETFGNQGHGRWIISATDATSFAFDGEDELVKSDELRLGVFTRHLIGGLRTGEAAPSSETITVQQLFDFARENVRAEDPRMKPQLWASKSDGPLILARNPNPKKPFPDEILGHLEAADHIVRQGAVIEISHLSKEDSRLRKSAISILKEHLDKERDFSVRNTTEKTINELLSSHATKEIDLKLPEYLFLIRKLLRRILEFYTKYRSIVLFIVAVLIVTLMTVSEAVPQRYLFHIRPI